MARIRTIKPEFFCHEELFDLEEETGMPIRIAFAGLWTVCDREGRFKWRPRTIKAQIMPYDNLDFSRVLDALATRGFVVRYASNGCEYGHVPGFGRHQVINNRENASTLPEPPKTQEKTGLSRVVDACPTRDERVPHAGKEDGKGREGKGREGERKGNTAEAGVNEFFESWWIHYPRKVSKGDAAKAYAKALKTFSAVPSIAAERLLQASLPRLAEVAKKDPQFIPYPASWLNDRGWEDEIASIAPASKAGSSGQGPGVNYDPNHDYESEAF
jgi:hypothetical protein